MKHEYDGGEIVAMAGGSRRDNALMARVIAALENARKPGCVVFTSDQRIRVLATGRTTYPDASVVCGAIEGDPADPAGPRSRIPRSSSRCCRRRPSRTIAATSGSTTSAFRRCRNMYWSASRNPASSDTAGCRATAGSTTRRRPERCSCCRAPCSISSGSLQPAAGVNEVLSGRRRSRRAWSRLCPRRCSRGTPSWRGPRSCQGRRRAG